MIDLKDEKFKKFGDYLKLKRKELNVSQQDLENKTDMDRTYISMLENKGNPSFFKIQEICNALGITVEEFFRIETKEAQKPTILINFNKEEKERRHKESMIKENCVPIPIINSDKPLKTGKIEDDDIQGYIMLDRETLGKDGNDKLVAVRHIPAVPFPLIIIDLDDKDLTEGKLYAIEKNGIKLRKAYNSGKGVVFQSMWNSEKPTAIFGKQKDFIKVLGRVVLGLAHFVEKPA